ncbi:MAG: pyrroloquinoline quinone biosynthesis protein PqqB [Chloroflexi bacterium]|nr:pyrroloquinoline quinone biosynthesis protein PqqB [Chloroflexota bacterium]
MPVEIILLGVAQDGGVPQAGCYCQTCTRARETPAARQFVSCLGIVDRRRESFWMIDATPDFREQLHLLQTCAPDCRLGGIFITHAHIGHYAGLVHLGREAMNTRRLLVYATQTFGEFLRDNAPWKQLIEIENIEWRRVQPEDAVRCAPDLSVVPVAVPHRGEFSDTVGYLIRGSHRTLFFCPDIDRWSRCEFDVRDFLDGVDIALLDATFFDQGELPGRDMSQVPHPLVRDSVEFLRGIPAEICFVHLNHTNPLWRDGAERKWVVAQGFTVGEQGQRWMV